MDKATIWICTGVIVMLIAIKAVVIDFYAKVSLTSCHMMLTSMIELMWLSSHHRRRTFQYFNWAGTTIQASQAMACLIFYLFQKLENISTGASL